MSIFDINFVWDPPLNPFFLQISCLKVFSNIVYPKVERYITGDLKMQNNYGAI